VCRELKKAEKLCTMAAMLKKNVLLQRAARVSVLCVTATVASSRAEEDEVTGHHWWESQRERDH
jgi:hypothetical protein